MDLRTRRLVLRDFAPADSAAAFSYHTEPRYLRYYRPGKWSVEDSRVLVERFVEWARARPRQNYQLAVALEGRFIGCAGVRQAGLEAGTAEFGIELDPRFWGRGYALEAGESLFNFAFGELHLERLVARCINANSAIRRLLERLGMEWSETLEPKDWMRVRGWALCLYQTCGQAADPQPPGDHHRFAGAGCPDAQEPAPGGPPLVKHVQGYTGARPESTASTAVSPPDCRGSAAGASLNWRQIILNWWKPRVWLCR